MKTLKFTSVIIGLSLAFTAHGANYTFVPANEWPTTKICVAAAQDNGYKLRQNVKMAHMSISRVVKKVKCNGVSITEFAVQYGALKTAASIGRYRSGRVTISDLVSKVNSYQKQQLKSVVVVAGE